MYKKNENYFLGVQKTHLEYDSLHLIRHYNHWRLRSLVHSENLLESELMYTALVSLSRKDFDTLREEMTVFIKNFLDRVHESPAEEIACFNLDFFWIKK